MKIRIHFFQFCLAIASAHAAVQPAPLFSDHMVLQSGMAVPIWGTADPGEKVTVKLGAQSKSTIAGADGKWMLRLASLKSGGPFEMTVTGKTSITVKDVLVGEVWIGSGQSNMEFTVSKAKARFAGLVDEDKEIAAANHPQIRMFTAKHLKAFEPQPVLEGEWLVCNPENVPGFSAVGYLFARDLQKEINTPVGIVTMAYGASTAEAWIRREALASDTQLQPMIERFDALTKFYRDNPGATTDQIPAAARAPQTINSRQGKPGPLRDPVQDQHQPTVLFNGMIHSAIPYAMRGVLWYQGESIVGGKTGVALYPHVMETLVKDWRKLWGEGDFPFYAVQLAALGNVSNNPMVRESQWALTALPNSAVAITIDIGDPKDVHPANKAPLGDRLARIALANVYGRKIEYYGPVYQGMKIEGGTIRLQFSHLGGGLVAKDGPLKWFQIAGEDRKFVDAEAKIEGEAVIVSSLQINAPVAVRYAWDNYPEGCNLYNGAGLPAGPFRTDKWDSLTKISEQFTAK